MVSTSTSSLCSMPSKLTTRSSMSSKMSTMIPMVVSMIDMIIYVVVYVVVVVWDWWSWYYMRNSISMCYVVVYGWSNTVTCSNLEESVAYVGSYMVKWYMSYVVPISLMIRVSRSMAVVLVDYTTFCWYA